MLTHLSLSGSPFEMGKQAGSKYRAMMAATLPSWGKWPEDPDQRRKYMAMIENMAGYLSTTFPDAVAEMRGVAVGAGISFEEAFLLSAGNAVGPAVPYFGCSSVAFSRSDMGPILGKSDDGSHADDPQAALQQRLGKLLAMTVRPQREYAALCVAPVGTLWAECGVNERGLCIGTSSGHPERSRADAWGVPQHMWPRLILLNCADVQEAVDFCSQHDTVGKGLNMVLVDEKGQAAAVEATFSLHGVRKPEQDVIFATNHYIAPEMQVFGAQTNPDYINTPYFQNSLNRTANLYKRFGEGRELTLAEMKATLMDHHSPGGLCQHPENNEAGWQTFYGALLLSHSQEIWINEGFPCADRFERYALS